MSHAQQTDQLAANNAMRDRRPTVLLLDDFPDACDAIGTWLALQGWRAVATSTVEEALAVLARERMDAVVLEPHLRAGSAVAVPLAARSSGFGCPLIVSLSASGRAGDPLAYEPTLYDFSVVKPVPMEKLARILATARTL